MPKDHDFAFRDKRLGVCSLCSAKDYTYDVGSLALSARFCKSCIKRHGAIELRKDSNAALQRSKVVTRKATQRLKDMDEKYAARFGAGSRIRWVFDPTTQTKVE